MWSFFLITTSSPANINKYSSRVTMWVILIPMLLAKMERQWETKNNELYDTHKVGWEFCKWNSERRRTWNQMGWDITSHNRTKLIRFISDIPIIYKPNHTSYSLSYEVSATGRMLFRWMWAERVVYVNKFLLKAQTSCANIDLYESWNL